MSNLNEDPDTVSVSRGVTMTFLKDHEFLSRVTITGDSDCEGLFVPFHWHETHDEVMRVVKGQLRISLGSTSKIYSPEDGEVLIPRMTPHSLKSIEGVPTEFMERTIPMDDEKEVFFRNLLAGDGLNASIFHVMQTFYHGDTYPALPFHIIWFEKAFTALFGYYIAPFLGYQLKYASSKRAR
ncbi:hypothetical protein V5O48_002095 [Marasmius crinis-equi]|uniref:Cupin 2 conserved barrel domain-containing protein n=1 Tax=Marasmius crinis-equi TaxID=585013 RepID=A0ABR3FXF0_9AGAR